MIIRMTINSLLSKLFVCNLPPPPLSPPSPPPPQPPSPPLHFQKIRYYRCHMINRNLQHFQFETILRLHPDTVGPHDTDIPNICVFFFVEAPSVQTWRSLPAQTVCINSMNHTCVYIPTPSVTECLYRHSRQIMCNIIPLAGDSSCSRRFTRKTSQEQNKENKIKRNGDQWKVNKKTKGKKCWKQKDAIRESLRGCAAGFPLWRLQLRLRAKQTASAGKWQSSNVLQKAWSINMNSIEVEKKAKTKGRLY